MLDLPGAITLEANSKGSPYRGIRLTYSRQTQDIRGSLWELPRQSARRGEWDTEEPFNWHDNVGVRLTRDSKP
jgi:hypothetical protein